MLYTIKCTRMYSAKLFGSLEAEKMAFDFFYTVMEGAVNASDVKNPEMSIQMTVPQVQSDIQDDEWRTVTEVALCTYIEDETRDDSFYEESSQFLEMLLDDTKFEWRRVTPQ